MLDPSPAPAITAQTWSFRQIAWKSLYIAYSTDEGQLQALPSEGAITHHKNRLVEGLHADPKMTSRVPDRTPVHAHSPPKPVGASRIWDRPWILHTTQIPSHGTPPRCIFLTPSPNPYLWTTPGLSKRKGSAIRYQGLTGPPNLSTLVVPTATRSDLARIQPDPCALCRHHPAPPSASSTCFGGSGLGTI